VIPVGSGYTTVPGDKFQSVADGAHVARELSQQTASIYSGLLIPAAPMALPPVARLTYVISRPFRRRKRCLASPRSGDAASPRWTRRRRN